MKLRYWLIALVVGAVGLWALSPSPARRPYSPLQYGYSLTLELADDKKIYTATENYSCNFDGSIDQGPTMGQAGTEWGAELLLYEAEGRPLTIKLDDGRVIGIAFSRNTFGFCPLNDGARFWGWSGLARLETASDSRNALFENGFIDPVDFREAAAVVEAASRERRRIDLLAAQKLEYDLWSFDAADPTIMRFVDWRAPERALGTSVAVRSIVIEALSEPIKPTDRADARGHVSADHPMPRRWVTWNVGVVDGISIAETAKNPLPGDLYNGEARFSAVSRKDSHCKNDNPNGPHPSDLPGRLGQYLAPRIDASKNRVSLVWEGPNENRHSYGDRDFVRFDKLPLSKAKGLPWLLWNPEFCIDDGACFRLGSTPFGDGYPFDWRNDGLASFSSGSTRCVHDRKTNLVYRVRLFAKTW